MSSARRYYNQETKSKFVRIVRKGRRSGRELKPLLLDLSFYVLNVEGAALSAARSTSGFALKAFVDQLADVKNGTCKYYPDNDLLYHKAQN